MTAALLTALAIALSSPAPVPGGILQVQATTAFDGTWSGSGTLTQRRGRGTACSTEDTNRRFTIQGGQITFPYDNRYGVNFNGPIQPNGSFDIASGQHRWQGQATGSEMTATYTGPECVRSFTMRRRRN